MLPRLPKSALASNRKVLPSNGASRRPVRTRRKETSERAGTFERFSPAMILGREHIDASTDADVDNKELAAGDPFPFPALSGIHCEMPTLRKASRI
jgi:hypothetical protein